MKVLVGDQETITILIDFISLTRLYPIICAQQSISCALRSSKGEGCLYPRGGELKPKVERR